MGLPDEATAFRLHAQRLLRHDHTVGHAAAALGHSVHLNRRSLSGTPPATIASKVRGRLMRAAFAPYEQAQILLRQHAAGGWEVVRHFPP
jgi:hypothetical protein